MPEHLTSDDLRAYAGGAASPETLLRWDDHLAQCGECRGRLIPGASLAAWASNLADAEDGGHLSHEQLVACAEHHTPDADRFAIETHLRSCGACREEVADLAAFRRANSPRRKTWLWLIPIAAALAVAFWIVRTPPRRPEALQLPAQWTAEDRALVENALRSGSLPVAAPPADLSSKAGKLLGPSAPDAFSPLSPLGTIVESDRPEFQWTALPGASSYRVEIYDSEFHPVMQSAALTVTSWTPEKALDRGGLYQWQITAVKGSEAITAPAPPAPDARFRILDAAEEERITGARASGPEGRLLAAILLAQAGMHVEAVKELDTLPPQIRQFPEVEKLVRTEWKY